MSKIKEKANKYLEQSRAAQVHATSDEFLFNDERHAKAHAKTLKNKEVKTFKAKQKAAKELTADQTLELNLTELFKTVSKIENVDDVYILKTKEEEEENPRKGALAIFDVRIKELLPDEDDKDDSKGQNDAKDTKTPDASKE